MDIPGILDFLKVLAANNNREWFQEHKAEYLSVQADFEELLAGVIARLSPWDESVAHVLPRDCTYRIYRDVRFSSDKSPYKTHIGGYINARGSWCMPADMLRAVRQSVCDRIDEYRAIVEDPAFKEYFPVVGESHLKTVPKGFPKDFPYPQYIRCKDFTVACRVEDEFFSRPDFMERIIDVFRQLKRFADFTNETIDEFE